MDYFLLHMPTNCGMLSTKPVEICVDDILGSWEVELPKYWKLGSREVELSERQPCDTVLMSSVLAIEYTLSR